MIKQLNDKLSKEEEIALGVKIQEMRMLKERMEAGYDEPTEEERRIISEGDEAFETLVGNYYNLARKIAHQHHKRTGTRYSIEDLLQDAISALCESAYNFDPAKNCKLSTYAFYGITKRVSTTINYQRLVRLPENKMGEYIEITKAQKEYNELTSDEQAEITELDYIYQNVGDLKREEVDLILENMQPQVSLNAIINEGNGELMDLIGDDEPDSRVIQYKDLDENVADVVSQLDPYERDLIAYEFGVFPASMPYSEFLVKYDKTDRQVTIATRRAIRKMRSIAEEVGE